VNSLAYYGLSWSTGNLGGNDYLNFCLSGIMEFPGYGLLLFTLNRYGRKFTLCGALLVGGVALLLTLFVPPGKLIDFSIGMSYALEKELLELEL